MNTIQAGHCSAQDLWTAESCVKEHKIAAFAQSLLTESNIEHFSSRISAFQQAGGDRVQLIEEAIKNEYSALLPLLLSKGAFDQPLRGDDSALHIACRHKCHRCMNTLISLGANVNAAGRNGMTPLHYAILIADPEGEHLLLKGGADPVKKDCREETPYSLPFRLCNRRACRHVLRKLEDSPEKLPYKKSELRLTPSLHMIVPFLTQDAEWIQATAQRMDPAEFQKECDALKAAHPSSDFTLVEDARLTLKPEHLLELTTIAQSNLPEQEKLDAQDLAELMPLFDCINLTDPDEPGYRNPANIRDANGHTYTAEELRDKLTELVSDVAKRTPKAGIPPLDLGDFLSSF